MKVGCGAIGCEMLKNYAMMGIGRKPSGKVGKVWSITSTAQEVAMVVCPDCRVIEWRVEFLFSQVVFVLIIISMYM